MMKCWVVIAVLCSAASCRNAPKPSDALAAANMAALEQTVDMENGVVETDEVLKFARTVFDLGDSAAVLRPQNSGRMPCFEQKTGKKMRSSEYL